MTNILGTIFLACTATVFLAQTVVQPSALQYTVQYSALGILGWAVWYMLTKAFPRQLKMQQEERREIREEFRQALDTILEIVRENNE